MSHVVLTLRVLIGGVFLVAVASKTYGRAPFTRFTAAVRQIAGVPGRAAVPSAVGVLLAEAAVVTLLAVPGLEPAGFLLAVLLLAGFSAVLAAALRRGVTASCQCFGAGRDAVGRRHVVRNGVLLLGAAAGACLAPAADPAAVAPSAAVLCVTAAAIAVAATVLLDDLLYLLR